MDRRQFIKSAVAAGVSVALFPRFEAEAPVELSAYPIGDIRRYGAVADGITDCTHAIQMAMDTGKAYIPSGSWRT